LIKPKKEQKPEPIITRSSLSKTKIAKTAEKATPASARSKPNCLTLLPSQEGREK
jgi:hypothetical protein